MAFYEIGGIIRKRRKQMNLSLETLAGNVLTPANLSKLENGVQITRRDKLEIILDKLGLNTKILYSYCVTKSENLILQKKQHLKNLIYEGKNDEALQFIDVLSSDNRFGDNTDRQFLLYAKAGIMANKGADCKQRRQDILDALNITMLIFSEHYIKDYLFSNQEAQLVNMLAITYFDEGNIDKSIEVLYALKHSLEFSKIEEAERTDIFPLVLYNLSKYLGLSGRYYEVIELCDNAINLCVKYNNIHFLPEIIYNKAYALREIGDRQLCARLLNQAYYICDVIGHCQKKELIKSYANEKFGIAIDAD